MECEYSEIINLETDPEKPAQWSYSKASCVFETIELIESGNSEEFYLDKRVSYGDVLVISFLMLYLVLGILKFLTDFLVPKLINFKRK